MSIDKSNQVVGFDVTFESGSPAFLGWVRLKGPGGTDAGYVYLEDTPVVPNLGSTGYVVMSMPVAQFPSLLAVLSSKLPMTIRYFDPQAPGVKPSAELFSDRAALAGLPLAESEALSERRRGVV